MGGRAFLRLGVRMNGVLAKSRMKLLIYVGVIKRNKIRNQITLLRGHVETRDPPRIS